MNIAMAKAKHGRATALTLPKRAAASLVAFADAVDEAVSDGLLLKVVEFAVVALEFFVSTGPPVGTGGALDSEVVAVEDDVAADAMAPAPLPMRVPPLMPMF